MLNWLTRRRSEDPGRARPDAAKGQRAAMPGKSAPLYKYLNERYADAVILTFAEVEDLLGCALPALARASETWWTGPDPDGTQFAASWILADRTARPNLQALTVASNRIP